MAMVKSSLLSLSLYFLVLFHAGVGLATWQSQGVQGRGYIGVIIPGCPETFQLIQSQDKSQRIKYQHQKTLAEAFGVSTETARKLQNKNDQRGHIIRVENGLQFIQPPRGSEEEQERQQWMSTNGLEETLCNTRLRENIGRPSRADIYSPNGGRISSLNSQKLPILNYLQMSAERGVLYRERLAYYSLTLRKTLKFKSLETMIRLSSKENSVKTNDNGMISPLAGRTSAIRAMSVDVLTNAFKISKQEAMQLKNNRGQELIVLSPRSRSQGRAEA
ncbi:hypothetical protein GIB67_026873 [Kingdonia uniflora]|uniref:Cupin type-1 domain-containing protein n=1 Tax=Kingdonia uniflora TaxID=39325 RepID=A0A7J7M7Y4_9MAGN|nr:hypothetical protein GIB67_026873 [Kingdonia uniflora]